MAASKKVAPSVPAPKLAATLAAELIEFEARMSELRDLVGAPADAPAAVLVAYTAEFDMKAKRFAELLGQEV